MAIKAKGRLTFNKVDKMVNTYVRYSNDGGKTFTNSPKSDYSEVPDAGRNLLLSTNSVITNNEYRIQGYRLTRKLEWGKTYTFSCKFKAGNDRTEFRGYYKGGIFNLLGIELKEKESWVYLKSTFTLPTEEKASDKQKVVYNNTNPPFINIYVGPKKSKSISSITEAKLEIGNTATPYSPAPEDIDIGTTTGDWIGTCESDNNYPLADPSDYTWTKVKGEQGNPGTPAYALNLSPSHLVFDTDNAGIVPLTSLSANTCTVRVTKGTEQKIPTIKLGNWLNGKPSLNQNGVISITAISKDSATGMSFGCGYVDFTATLDGKNFLGRIYWEVNIHKVTAKAITEMNAWGGEVRSLKKTVSGGLTSILSRLKVAEDNINLEIKKTISCQNLLIGSSLLMEEVTVYGESKNILGGIPKAQVEIGNNPTFAVHGARYIHVRSVGNKQAVSAGTRMFATNLDPNGTYTLGVWLMCKDKSKLDEGLWCEVQYDDIDGVFGWYFAERINVQDSGVWQRYSVTFGKDGKHGSIPKNIRNLRVNFCVRYNGEVYLSNFTLVRGSKDVEGATDDGELIQAFSRTGINIKDRKIEAQADNFEIKNNAGKTTFSVDAEGNLVGTGNARFDGIMSSGVTVINPRNFLEYQGGNGYTSIGVGKLKPRIEFRGDDTKTGDERFKFYNPNGAAFSPPTYNTGAMIFLVGYSKSDSTWNEAMRRCVGHLFTFYNRLEHLKNIDRLSNIDFYCYTVRNESGAQFWKKDSTFGYGGHLNPGEFVTLRADPDTEGGVETIRWTAVAYGKSAAF